MKNRVITISREFGSGGRTIGKKVAEKLGIPCYDSELIQELEKQTGFAADYVKEAGEYAPGGFLASALSNRMFGPTNEDILWAQQYKVITALAEHPTLSTAQMQEAMAKCSPGDTVTITYYRDGKKHNAQVTLRNNQGDTTLTRAGSVTDLSLIHI